MAYVIGYALIGLLFYAWCLWTVREEPHWVEASAFVVGWPYIVYLGFKMMKDK